MSLVFLVWAVDFFSTASFFSIGDFIFVSIMLGAAVGVLLGAVSIYNIDANREDEIDIKGMYQKIAIKMKWPYVAVLVLAVFGSILEAIIPDDKNTIYLMVGAYYTDKTIEDCKTEGSLCNRIGKKLEAKINSAIEEMDNKDVEEVVKETIEKVSEPVDNGK